MSKYSPGRILGRYSRVRYGIMRNDPLTQAVSRLGKESKYGPRKGSTPPGNHSDNVKL